MSPGCALWIAVRFSDALLLLLPSGLPEGSPCGREGWDEGRVLALWLQPSLSARVQLTQRAFRSPAGARVTFSLLAQRESNPREMALIAHSITWDASLTGAASRISGGPRPTHSGYTATRRCDEDLIQAWPKVATWVVCLRPDDRHTNRALSPLRDGALRCSHCV